MSSRDTSADKVGATSGWHPISVRPPKGTTQLWVYCPGYPFMPVRKAGAELLQYHADATHWHLIDAKGTQPAPPEKRG